MMKIGSHVGMSGKEMFLGSVKEALSYGADTLMVYTGAPQNTRRKAIEELRVEEGWNLMKEKGMDEIVIHAPYIINLANTVKPETYELAGKGSEIGRNFEELAAIYEGVRYNDKLRVCFDTCHVHDAGYDIVHDFSGVMSQFDKVIGQDQIAVFHVNDSKNPCGAHKDRHENVGFGEIGFEALMQVVNCPDFEQIPKILETPYIPDAENKKKSYAPYKFEIEMIRKGLFDAQLKEKILQAAK